MKNPVQKPKITPPTTVVSPKMPVPGILFILPLLNIYATTQDNLLTWLLIAVVAAIVLMFILIAFILLPLSRRSDTPAQPSDTAAPDDDDKADTEPLPDLSTDDEKDETQPDLEAVEGETDPNATTVSIAEPRPTAATAVAEPQLVPISGERPDSIGWQIAGLTDVGLKRQLNEDSFMMIEGEITDLGPYGLYVVADGLGGHEAGEIASRITVNTIQHQLERNPPTATAAPFEEWFKDAIMAANEAVLKYQDGHKEAQKMGSTLIMALLVGQEAHISNVGDSRAYHLTKDDIKQISIDHSLVERLVQIGQITREEARTHKQRNVVYSIIGEKRKLEVGYYHVELAPGDRLLLCSDGLSGMVTDEKLAEISQQEADLGRAGQQMVEAAKQAGGHDNITALLVEMKSD